MSVTLPDMITDLSGNDVSVNDISGPATVSRAGLPDLDEATAGRPPRVLAARDPGSVAAADQEVSSPGPVRRGAAATIGSRIRTLRRARGLTQDTLAVSTGVSRSAVAQWETGRAGQMSGKLRRIAEALGVSVSMLRDGWEGIATDSVLSTEEMSLLRLFRLCDAPDRAVLIHVAQKLAEPHQAE